MFPIKDIEGRVIGFGGRVIKSEDQPKYMNSPESPVYSKRRSFYGIDKSRDFIRREGRAVLVEGYTDFLGLYSSGIKNVVATLGTSLTHDHGALLRRYTENVIVLFDSDESGVKASVRSLDVLLEEGLMPHVSPLPPGEDPDSFIKKHGPEEFKKLISDSESWIEFFLNRMLGEHQRGALTRSQLRDEVVELLKKVKNPVELSVYVQRDADKLSMPESNLHSLIKQKRGKEKSAAGPSSSYTSHEKLLLTIVLKYPSLSEVLSGTDWRALVQSEDIKSILEEIVSNDVRDVSNLLVHFNNRAQQDLISAFLLSSDSVQDIEQAANMLKTCIRKLESGKIDDRLKALRLELDRALKDRDSKTHKRLLEEYTELIKQK